MGNTIDIIKSFSEEEIESVSISCSAVDLTVTMSHDGLAHIECKNVRFGSTADINGGVLCVNVKEPELLDKLFGDLLSPSACRISLPDKLYGSFTTDLGVGNGKIGPLQCTSATVTVGAGNIHISGLNAEDTASLKVGAGNMTLDKSVCGMLEVGAGTGNVDIVCDTNGLNIQGGVGNISFDGRADGDVFVKGGIGNVRIRLHDRHEGEYKLRTEHGLGKLDVEYV